MTVQEWLNNNELSITIWEKKYQHNNETFDEWLERVSNHNSEIKRLIREKKFLFGGRTLANRNIEGSGSYSNCYSRGFINDSLADIMQAATDIAMTFKAQGGQGLSLSKIRPKGSMIKDRFQSDGIIPFMHIFNSVTESISQGGSRKGALMMSLDVWHKEIESFVRIKENPNEINKANLSVEIDDDFMRIVDKYYQIGEKEIVHVVKEYENQTIEYDVDPVEVFKMICKSAWKSAEPGVLFVNRLRNYNMMQYVDDYQIETTNPCGEQPLNQNGSCNLCSINLAEYVTDPYTSKAKIDYISLEKDVREITFAMDDVLDENLERHALKEQKEMAAKYRNVGIGILGLADLFVMLGIKYGDPDSIGLIGHIMKIIFRSALFASVENAEYRGNFPGYDPKVWDADILKLICTEEEISQLRKNNKLRNATLLSVAPTGSIGTLLMRSTGVEPFFMLSYRRKTISLNGGEDKYYDVDILASEEYKNITGDVKLPNYFVTSAEINWKDRIDVQAKLQDYVDTAISSTINLPKTTTLDEIEQLYLYAWKKGLKGCTIYVDGSRDPILSAKESESAPIKISSDQLKRGEIIKAGDNCIGLKRTLMTGCGTLHVEAFFDPQTGALMETYLSKGSTGGCQSYMVGLSRMMSLAARGGVSIDKIIDQLGSCVACPSYAVRRATHKDTSKGSCCPVAVGNALKDMHAEILERIQKCIPVNAESQSIEVITDKKQSTDELDECPECHAKTLIHEGGCISCTSCGFSKCG